MDEFAEGMVAMVLEVVEAEVVVVVVVEDDVMAGSVRVVVSCLLFSKSFFHVHRYFFSI